MTTAATARTADFATCDALTKPITASEWLERFAPGMLECAEDHDELFADVTACGHADAARLGVPHSEAGAYPAVIWAMGFETTYAALR